MSYITFTSLGSSADLGSQLQQYSSLYAIAKKNNKKIAFPESAINLGWGIKFKNLLQVDFEVRPDSFFNNFTTVTPKDVVLDSSVFTLDDDTNYNFNNLFHLYHYWYGDYKNDIYNWKWNLKYEEMALDTLNSIPSNGKELVSIHVRRGDYLKHNHFCKLDVQYYSDAVSHFLPELEKYHFVVFSNDIEWCKENLIDGEMVTFLEQGIDYSDLICMSMCNHNIIANSSFSWWAAFKNKNINKKIICPQNYIRSYSNFSFINKNWYPLDWISIYNDER